MTHLYWLPNSIIIFLLGSLFFPVYAQIWPAQQIISGQVSHVSEKGLITLTSGEEVALHGVHILHSHLSLQQEAHSWLNNRLLGQPIFVAGPAPVINRHHQITGQIYTAGKTWVQGKLVDAGLAFVTPDPVQPAMAKSLIEREKRARYIKAGLWSSPASPFISVQQLMAQTNQHIGTYRIVQGVIISATRVKAQVYLNFGPNYRNDFTVRLDGYTRRALEKQGYDPENWTGKEVIVRGVLFERNGPMLAPMTPAEIQLEPF